MIHREFIILISDALKYNNFDSQIIYEAKPNQSQNAS